MTRSRWSSVLPSLLLIVVSSASPACRNERPEECQRLRQCCAHVEGSGVDIEDVRMACTRKDDTDAVLCRRRLDEVVGAMPNVADLPQCRLGGQ